MASAGPSAAAGSARTAVADALASTLLDRLAELPDIDARLAGPAAALGELVLGGGKRMRSQFCWLGHLAAGGADDPGAAPAVITAGVAVELLHGCALAHDDLIDNSDLRRGVPTLHNALAAQHGRAGLTGDPEHFGRSAALLLGDLLLAWADDVAAGALAGNGAAGRVWSAMRTEVMAGQLLDLIVANGTGAEASRQAADAERVARYKTAAYTVERPLQLGAALAGAGPAVLAALAHYGRAVGVAFQLRDDLLGVFGDPEVTGKPAGDDLAEGKRTLLIAATRAGLADRGHALADFDAAFARVSRGGPQASERARLTGELTAEMTGTIAGSGAVEVVERRIGDLVASARAALDPELLAGCGIRLLTELADAATDRVR